ncbi:hypothetical protein [Vibrio sp. 10N.261.55.A7]|uniref:hypothetical protein n=1 Tax=Vibrio sp. 10N.261.55.A7 TaxID=1880851 RepID=UPI000C844B6E|nr:hypothetical protein [Vibrio sp. 10N.261.55.A7]PMK00358.1 hypothetical protein BCU12_20115 [Vibrio sp. 10N.261.55.A7]
MSLTNKESARIICIDFINNNAVNEVAREYAQHVRRLPMVEVSLDSLRFSFRWTMILSTLGIIVLAIAYFSADVEQQAGWFNGEDGSLIELLLITIFAAFVFLCGIDWVWEVKRLARRAGRKGFFKALLKIIVAIFCMPFALGILAVIYMGYWSILEAALTALA